MSTFQTSRTWRRLLPSWKIERLGDFRAVQYVASRPVDFDFAKQRPFTVRGFASAHDAWRFADMMESPEIQDFFRARIAERRERLRSMWGGEAAARGTEPCAATG